MVSVILTALHRQILGTSLAVQGLRLQTLNAGVMGLIPVQGSKILHAMGPKNF